MDQLRLLKNIQIIMILSRNQKIWGTVWLLSGKICQLPLNSTFFALPGDLVDETSVLSEVKWFVPVKTYWIRIQ